MSSDTGPEQIRLAELVAALSLGIDLGFGQPMEHVLRQCLIALRVAERLGLSEEDRVAVYYTALLINVGCHSDAHEQAKWFGDDTAHTTTKYDRGRRPAAAGARLFASGSPPLHRFRVGLEFAISGRRELSGMISRHAELAGSLAKQLDLPEHVSHAVGAAYEQWDGKGWPEGLRGDDVPIAARIAQLAEYVEVAHRLGGVDAAQALVRKKSGGQFDPDLVDLVRTDGDWLLAALDAPSTWDSVIAAEPALAVRLTSDQFDQSLLAIADFVDLKSPYTLGHGAAVADLAREAARIAGLPEREQRLVRRAGLAHGLGRLGVSNAIWDRPGPLGAGDWERVRMYPYLTQRMLQQSTALAPIGAVAVAHRERLDASGYPFGLSGAAISTPARLLGAAEAYQAKREARPHREALSADEAAAHLRGEVDAGRLDGSAVEAVLAAAGHRVARRREGAAAGLTSRETQVLQLLARGLSNREIARHLVISPKTAGNHVEHIYTKIQASTRVAAALYATQHGLLP
jgi:HD-GYP domain-containing protein (c-di-GMP phosphodiesterase class II)